MKDASRGFVTLVSVLIVCGVLMTLLIGASAASFYARADLFDQSAYQVARADSDACAKEALYRVSSADRPREVRIEDLQISLGTDGIGRSRTCRIESVVVIDASAHIATSAHYGSSMASTTVLASVFDTATAPLPPGEGPITIETWSRE